MSEKYSTGELVEIIKNGMLFVEGSKAIIAKLRAGDRVVKSAIEVMGNLALWDDPEFDELRKEVDKYEEEK